MNIREIVFDTETTGLDPFSGDKIVEIGAVELINHRPTGKEYHQYINPLCSMSEEVVAVHGLTEQFLSQKPIFSEICDDFLAFIGQDARLVAHNAPFDMSFLNTELKAAGHDEIGFERVVDTLPMARKRFPGARVNLDELCRRFGVDNSARTVHGALLDAQLLADVYFELLGGAEPSLMMADSFINAGAQEAGSAAQAAKKEFHQARVFDVPADELAHHDAFVQKLKNAIWLKDDDGKAV